MLAERVPLSEAHRRRLHEADAATLLAWSELALTAAWIDDILH